MTSNIVGKFAAVLLLGAGLAGCMDADVEVSFMDSETAHVMTTTTMGADFYGMIKAAEAEAPADGDDAMGEFSESFCAEGDLTENADGSAVCVEMMHGTLDELNAQNEEEGGIHFAAQDDGTVRVSMPMSALNAQLGAEEEMDADTKAMMVAMFEGHAITFTIIGEEILDTNMTVSDDKTSVSLELEFAKLLAGDTEFPKEYYALVRTP
ncbi:MULTISPECIES: hypothetical protein [unclassified Devosia]|uniref:hypothetical protein n=1 Tax=unclassified Devosia TaxID=196773 RepID=UPI00145E622D|nr:MULTISPECIES: hypothetical protein [unclassified Devosia]MBJ6987178.1 hypothetical protein [Devosia sp. MC521]QMW62792.1 hypothetical protein H4N61_18235 [Devosia sp. MC521]